MYVLYSSPHRHKPPKNVKLDVLENVDVLYSAALPPQTAKNRQIQFPVPPQTANDRHVPPKTGTYRHVLPRTAKQPPRIQIASGLCYFACLHLATLSNQPVADMEERGISEKVSKTKAH